MQLAPDSKEVSIKTRKRPINPFFAKQMAKRNMKFISEVAMAARMSHGTVLAYATGRTVVGNAETVIKLATVFGLTPNKLSEGMKKAWAELGVKSAKNPPGARLPKCTPAFRKLMKDAGFVTIRELSYASGIAASVLYWLAKGETKFPNPANTVKLAKAFHVEPAELMNILITERFVDPTAKGFGKLSEDGSTEIHRTDIDVPDNWA